MRIKSHAVMGHYLLREYMPGISRRSARAFLLGCVQPDRNPTTYLKGSLRSRWMQGHNYDNAGRYMGRLTVRLEEKDHFSVWDYYSLGKLIHYTMDAFTFPHNEHFTDTLPAHRQYEIRLQNFFLSQFRECRKPLPSPQGSAVELLRQMHSQYIHLPGCVETDTAYTFTTCCHLVEKITANLPIPPLPATAVWDIPAGK